MSAIMDADTAWGAVAAIADAFRDALLALLLESKVSLTVSLLLLAMAVGMARAGECGGRVGRGGEFSKQGNCEALPVLPDGNHLLLVTTLDPNVTQVAWALGSTGSSPPPRLPLGLLCNPSRCRCLGRGAAAPRCSCCLASCTAWRTCPRRWG